MKYVTAIAPLQNRKSKMTDRPSSLNQCRKTFSFAGSKNIAHFPHLQPIGKQRQIIIQIPNCHFNQVCRCFRGALAKPPRMGIVQSMTLFHLSGCKVVKGEVEIVSPVNGGLCLFGLGDNKLGE